MLLRDHEACILVFSHVSADGCLCKQDQVGAKHRWHEPFARDKSGFTPRLSGEHVQEYCCFLLVEVTPVMLERIGCGGISHRLAPGEVQPSSTRAGLIYMAVREG